MVRVMVFVLALLLTFPSLFDSGSAPAKKQPFSQDILTRLRLFYKSIKTVSGNFLQKNYLPSGQIKIYSGRFWIKKPDKIKWEYLSPDRFTILYTFKKLYIYYPEEDEVFVYSAEKNYSSKLVLELLSGKFNFKKELHLKKIVRDSQKECKLIFNPPEGSYLQKIEVTLDCKSGKVKRFYYESNVGEKIEVFLTKVVYNSVIPEKIFKNFKD